MSNAQIIPFPTSQPVEGVPPPFDLEAEAAVLSACLLNGDALVRIRDFLRPEHFFSERHAWLFRAIVALEAEKTRADAVTCIGWLRDRRRTALVEPGYITEVLDAAPAITGPRCLGYAERVHGKWRARQIIALCQRFAAEGYHDYGDVQTYAERAAQALLAVARAAPMANIESNADALRRILRERLEPVATGKRPQGLPTGLPGLDALIAGLRPGKKTTVAALTGRGKTALGLQAALRAAIMGTRALLVSVEVSRDDILQRALAALGSLDHDRLRKGNLDRAEWSRLMPAMDQLSALPLDIVDTHDIHVGQIAAMARRLTEVPGQPLGLVVVDYVQRLTPSPELVHAKKHEQVAHATKALKLLAQDLGIAVLELAQAKPAEGGRDKRPDAGSVCDSQAIAKEADCLVFLHRPEEANRRRILAVVAKQRDGEEGECELTFEGEYQRFSDPMERFS